MRYLKHSRTRCVRHFLSGLEREWVGGLGYKGLRDQVVWCTYGSIYGRHSVDWKLPPHEALDRTEHPNWNAWFFSPAVAEDRAAQTPRLDQLCLHCLL